MMLINGRRRNSVSAADRGLAYGDGLFETLAVTGGRPRLWDAHLARLFEGCHRLALPLPDPELFANEVARLIGDTERGVLKLIYTRGVGGRGYGLPEAAEPNRIFSLHPAPAYPAEFWLQGVATRVCTLRLADQPALAGIKHLNRLEQVLARAECRQAEITEGLLLNQNGELVEATACNLFIARDGVLDTPVIDRAGVAGVMRARMRELARELGLDLRERPLPLAEVLAAEEIFLTNSVIGIWPVRTIDDRRFDVGPLTQRLQRRLAAEGSSLMPVIG